VVVYCFALPVPGKLSILRNAKLETPTNLRDIALVTPYAYAIEYVNVQRSDAKLIGKAAVNGGNVSAECRR
jgi:hypothetical protein